MTIGQVSRRLLAPAYLSFALAGILGCCVAARAADQGPTVGQEVPEIEGEDIDGVPFKLSDYRGQVVVLDFWGDW